jgi:hypothetical protein
VRRNYETNKGTLETNSLAIGERSLVVKHVSTARSYRCAVFVRDLLAFGNFDDRTKL